MLLGDENNDAHLADAYGFLYWSRHCTQTSSIRVGYLRVSSIVIDRVSVKNGQMPPGYNAPDKMPPQKLALCALLLKIKCTCVQI